MAPCIAKIARRGESLHIIDPDQVEERNLVRQHFGPNDVGKNKAEVLAGRYHTPEVEVLPFPVRIEEDAGGNLTNMLYANGEVNGAVVLFSGVDSGRARQAIKAHVRQFCRAYRYPLLWIDAGNSSRSGQVLVTASTWPCSRVTMTMVSEEGHVSKAANYGGAMHNVRVAVQGWKAMPQVFRVNPEEEEEESCGARVDPQTLMVNQMAATVALNAASTILYGRPLSSWGWHFSTSNSLTPIPFQNTIIRWRSHDPVSGEWHIPYDERWAIEA